MKRTLASGLLFGVIASAQLIYPGIFLGTSDDCGNEDLSFAKLDTRPGYGRNAPVPQQPQLGFTNPGQIWCPIGYSPFCADGATLADCEHFAGTFVEGSSACRSGGEAYPENAPPFHGGGTPPLLNLPPSNAEQSSGLPPRNPNSDKAVSGNSEPEFLVLRVVPEPGPIVPEGFPPTERQSLREYLAEQAHEHAKGPEEKDQSSSESSESSDSGGSNDDEEDEPKKPRPTTVNRGKAASNRAAAKRCLGVVQRESKDAKSRKGAESDSDDEKGVEDEDEEEDRLEEEEEVRRREGTESETAESSGFELLLAKNEYPAFVAIFVAVLLMS